MNDLERQEAVETSESLQLADCGKASQLTKGSMGIKEEQACCPWRW
jgi:hypothetical protein